MKYLIFILIVTVLINCQYPVELDSLPATQKFLVIDVRVTQDYASANVYYSLDHVTSTGSYIIPKPPQANAYIINGKGLRYTFSNTTGLTDTLFRGTVGESYQLFVETEGKLFKSSIEIMHACPELDSVVVINNRESFRDPEDLAYDGFDVYAEARDIPGEGNFYQWDWVHYERARYCAVVYSRAEGRDVLLPCVPPDCWNISYNQSTIIQQDKLRDGQPLVQKVVRVPYANPPKQYYLRVEQRAITPSVFAYLRALESTTEHRGTLFDIPPQTLFNPNVKNTSEPGDQILGVFSVYSYRKKIIYIDLDGSIPDATPKIIYDPASYTGDPFSVSACIEGQFRTTIRPQGWLY